MAIVTCRNHEVFRPPLFAFPSKNKEPELRDGCSPGTIDRFHQSGWIQAHIFIDWAIFFSALH